MNVPFYIAQKISVFEKKSFSWFISRIAILAVALGIATMLIGTAITRGYQEIISEKFYNCWGHLHVTHFLADPSNILNDEKMQYDSNLVKKIASTKHVKKIESYTTLPCIIKTNDGIEGIVLKGVENHNHLLQQENFIVKGKAISFSDTSYAKEILLSQSFAKTIQAQVGSSFIIYFLQANSITPKARKIKVVGIFHTGLEEYDKTFAICDNALIQNVNKDSSHSIQGYEIYLDNMDYSSQVEEEIFTKYLQAPLEIYSVKKRFATVFSWLDMMKMNEKIIIIIMIIIALVNMISTLLILVLERTTMVGLLKSLGMKSSSLKSVFLWVSLHIIAKGVLFGTMFGLGICLLQKYTGIVKLNEEIYYINQVPISLQIPIIMGIILLTIFICLLILIIPSLIIHKISPTKALQFK